MAKALAKELSYFYIDTGAMYRGVTLFAMKERYVMNGCIDESGLEQALDRLFLTFRFNPSTECSEMHLGGTNIEKEIRNNGSGKKREPCRENTRCKNQTCCVAKKIGRRRQCGDGWQRYWNCSPPTCRT